MALGRDSDRPRVDLSGYRDYLTARFAPRTVALYEGEVAATLLTASRVQEERQVNDPEGRVMILPETLPIHMQELVPTRHGAARAAWKQYLHYLQVNYGIELPGWPDTRTGRRVLPANSIAADTAAEAFAQVFNDPPLQWPEALVRCVGSLSLSLQASIVWLTARTWQEMTRAGGYWVLNAPRGNSVRTMGMTIMEDIGPILEWNYVEMPRPHKDPANPPFDKTRFLLPRERYGKERVNPRQVRERLRELFGPKGRKW